MANDQMERKAKYIFVTGGVVSGLGKGITAASLGTLLRKHGYRVTVQKIDPYLNVNPSMMSPFQHGEVFVTDDGAETDLDLGHYERFLDTCFTQKSSITTGRLYSNIIEKERRGDYSGATVQIVPHVTNEIKENMRSLAPGYDIVIIEIGGTVGDMEQTVYIEAIRQFRKDLGAGNSVSIHVTLIPYIEASGEIKTKPTQSSVRDLQQLGVFADVLVCRTSRAVEIGQENREKIAMFGSLDSCDDVIHNKDCRTIYEVPLMFEKQNFDKIVLKKLGLPANKCDMRDWEKIVSTLCDDTLPEVRVVVVGQYTDVADAYISITEAVHHAGIANGVRTKIELVNAGEIEKSGAGKTVANADAIIVADCSVDGNGMDGKIAACKYARESGVPYLGLCSGMHIAVIEYARNVLGLKDATSAEFDPNAKNPLIIAGDKMRLGLYDCDIAAGTKAHKIYGAAVARERHRNKFEFNNAYRERLTAAGLKISGVHKKLDLAEIVELPSHPYFIAGQFHPEYISRPNRAHPLFCGLIAAAKTKK